MRSSAMDTLFDEEAPDPKSASKTRLKVGVLLAVVVLVSVLMAVPSLRHSTFLLIGVRTRFDSSRWQEARVETNLLDPTRKRWSSTIWTTIIATG